MLAAGKQTASSWPGPSPWRKRWVFTPFQKDLIKVGMHNKQAGRLPPGVPDLENEGSGGGNTKRELKDPCPENMARAILHP